MGIHRLVVGITVDLAPRSGRKNSHSLRAERVRDHGIRRAARGVRRATRRELTFSPRTKRNGGSSRWNLGRTKWTSPAWPDPRAAAGKVGSPRRPNGLRGADP